MVRRANITGDSQQLNWSSGNLISLELPVFFFWWNSHWTKGTRHNSKYLIKRACLLRQTHQKYACLQTYWIGTTSGSILVLVSKYVWAVQLIIDGLYYNHRKICFLVQCLKSQIRCFMYYLHMKAAFDLI